MRRAALGHVGTMTDEAATGVAYEVHDAPSLERLVDHEDDERHDDAEHEAARLRRFARLRATAPVEPMC